MATVINTSAFQVVDQHGLIYGTKMMAQVASNSDSCMREGDAGPSRGPLPKSLQDRSQVGSSEDASKCDAWACSYCAEHKDCFFLLVSWVFTGQVAAEPIMSYDELIVFLMLVADLGDLAASHVSSLDPAADPKQLQITSCMNI